MNEKYPREEFNELDTQPLLEETPVPENRAKDARWKTIEIGGEQYEAMQGLKDVAQKDGKEVDFSVDLYRHPETGMHIAVYSLGMNRPKNEPAPIRADYTCPCMDLGPSFSLLGHDCAEQRKVSFDTITDLGIGVIAVISNDTAAGNGHGSDAVHRQSTLQLEAIQQGQTIPSMEEAYNQMGYQDGDIRRHDVVAKVIATTLGDRPAISTTSNREKIQDFLQAGINIVPDTRIELVTSQSQNRQSHIGNRRGGAYDHLGEQLEPGPYLVNGSHVRLTPEVYRTRFITEPHKPPTRRLPN